MGSSHGGDFELDPELDPRSPRSRQPPRSSVDSACNVERQKKSDISRHENVGRAKGYVCAGYSVPHLVLL